MSAIIVKIPIFSRKIYIFKIQGKYPQSFLKKYLDLYLKFDILYPTQEAQL